MGALEQQRSAPRSHTRYRSSDERVQLSVPPPVRSSRASSAEAAPSFCTARACRFFLLTLCTLCFLNLPEARGGSVRKTPRHPASAGALRRPFGRGVQGARRIVCCGVARQRPWAPSL